MRIPAPTQIISVVTAFCGFHISPRQFSGGTTTETGPVWFSFPPIGSCLRFAFSPTFGMVLAVAGSCHPEVAQFVPRDISSVTWPAFVVTPGCAPQDHNSSSNTFQVHRRNIQPVYWSSAAYLKEQIAWNAPQIFHMDNRNDKEKFLPKSLQGVACCCWLYDLFQL